MNIAGGSDMAQKMVYIHSITPGSLAERYNKFKVGDEVVMVGNDLMVGLTWKAASDKINQLVGSFTIVAQRREIVTELEEKQKQKEMQRSGSDSFESDDDEPISENKKELPATISTNNTQLSEAGAVQQYSEVTKANKVMPSVHPKQPVVPANSNEPITFTVEVRVCFLNIFVSYPLQVNCPKSIPLGLNIAGGSDMLQKAIYVHSITPGSLADKCNKFKVGDEIVMAGNTKMAGLTWKAASDKINKLAGTFKIVAKRKNGSREQQTDPPDDFPDGPQPVKAIAHHQLLVQQRTPATAPELPLNAPPKPPSSAPPELPSNSPPKPSSGSPSKLSHADSFDSESGDEFLLKQESATAHPHVPLESTKPARAISMDSFDSESGDEELLLKEESFAIPPKPPPGPPPEPLSDVVTKPAHAISMDSFDSESGDEALLQQEQEMLGVPPKLSSAPPEPPPRAPPKSPKLDAVRTTVHHQQNQLVSFDSKDDDELQLQKEDNPGAIPLSTAAQLSKNSINSESDDDSAFTTQEETFTVIFNKAANTQLGISIKEDIDTTRGVGIRGIKKGSLADQDGRLRPGNKLLSVNEINLCGLTYKKTLEVLRNAGGQLKFVATRPAVGPAREPVTVQSSIDELSETSDNEELAEAMKVGEEKFTVEFHKEVNCKLGVTITGGIDTPTGDVGVKNIVKGSLADKDGRLQQGDKLLSVNGVSLSNVTNREALQILRNAGNHISIVAVRYVGVDKLKGTPLSSTVPSLTSSRNQSPRASRKALHDPIPEIPTPRRKMSKHFQPGKSTKSTSSLHESGHQTLPRDYGTVKAIELRKGAQGLGMQLIGGIDVNKPVTVKEVFPGGAAHQSGKIRRGDQVLEINGKSFAPLTHREVIELIKNEPEGKVTLLVKFASRK